jgi:hypothetical protein
VRDIPLLQRCATDEYQYNQSLMFGMGVANRDGVSLCGQGG